MVLHLLTADWHLDDQPENAYRWQMFDVVRDLVDKCGIDQIFVLGDMVDRKDYHSAAFINRLMKEITDWVAPWTILRGNHDTAIRPPSYFEFMEEYVSAPMSVNQLGDKDDSLLLLPFTATPTEDWKDIDFDRFKAVFMHATVTGAQVSNGIVLENPTFPVLPQHLKIYSGDIHHPQRVGNVTYVGAPHPVKFGDDYRCRMLVIDSDTYDIVEEIDLDPVRKIMLDIHHLDDLAHLPERVRPGDQVKVRLHIKSGAIDDLATFEAAFHADMKQLGVTVAGIEVDVNAPLVAGVDTAQSPEAILREFAMHEKLSEDMLTVGLDLLKEVE